MASYSLSSRNTLVSEDIKLLRKACSKDDVKAISELTQKYSSTGYQQMIRPTKIKPKDFDRDGTGTALLNERMKERLLSIESKNGTLDARIPDTFAARYFIFIITPSLKFK